MAEQQKEFKELGQKLAEHRVKAGYSQRQVAAALNLTTAQYVSNWERGLIRPSVDSMAVMCELYGIESWDMVDLLVDAFRGHLECMLEDVIIARKKRRNPPKGKLRK